jgi:hypothetical protein
VRSPHYSMRFGPDRNGPKPATRSLTAPRDFYQTGGYNRREHLLRQPSWKGELDGDVGLVRGERSAGLVTGQAGTGPQAPSSALPGEVWSVWRHPANVFLAIRDRLVFSVLR